MDIPCSVKTYGKVLRPPYPFSFKLEMPIWHFKFYVSSALMLQITTSIIFDTLIIPNDNFFTISNPKRKRAILRTAHHLYKFFANDFRSATIWGFARSFCNISCSSCGATEDASCDDTSSAFGVALLW